MEMQNKVQIGKEFEEKAIDILKKEGFEILEHSSKLNWGRTYDFIVIKNNEKCYVEVRGRKNGKYKNNFSINKKKLNKLRDLNKKVLILCINNEEYFIFDLDFIKEHTSPIYAKNNVKFYVISKNPNNKSVYKRILIDEKDDEFIKNNNINLDEFIKKKINELKEYGK